MNETARSDYFHLPPSDLPVGDGQQATIPIVPAPPAGVSGVLPAALFIGFATLEEWVRTADPSHPVLATKLIVPGSSLRGLQSDELLVVCQQITPENRILYCQLRAASLTRLYGEPFDPDWRARLTAWDSLWECVREVLSERGLIVQRGTVAHPQGLVLFQARTEGITFDARSGRYFRPAFPVLASGAT